MHVKQDHGMRRCWLKGQTGYADDAMCALPVDEASGFRVVSADGHRIYC